MLPEPDVLHGGSLRNAGSGSRGLEFWMCVTQLFGSQMKGDFVCAMQPISAILALVSRLCSDLILSFLDAIGAGMSTIVAVRSLQGALERRLDHARAVRVTGAARSIRADMPARGRARLPGLVASAARTSPPSSWPAGATNEPVSCDCGYPWVGPTRRKPRGRPNLSLPRSGGGERRKLRPWWRTRRRPTTSRSSSRTRPSRV